MLMTGIIIEIGIATGIVVGDENGIVTLLADPLLLLKMLMTLLLLLTDGDVDVMLTY